MLLWHLRPLRPILVLVVFAASACSADRTTPVEPTTPVEETTTHPSQEPAPSSTSPSQAPADEAPAASRVGRLFFGMHDGRVTQGITPDAPVGSLRLWDTSTSWLHLETSPGQFAWAPLDTAVDAAVSAGARPLLVLGQTPVFHASRPNEAAPYGPGAASMPDLAAWRRYVTAVAERYGNRIDYQIWNETNVIQYWSGTARQVAELTVTASRAIRRVAPRATIVAPAFALRLEGQQEYFARYWSLQSKGVDLAAAVDAAAVHLYPLAEDPPEAQVGLLGFARQVLEDHAVELPVWNTEINFGLQGGPAPPTIPVERQRAYLVRTYLLNAGLGVARVYWYRWDLSVIANTILMRPESGQATEAGRAFGTVRRWLENTAVQPCESSDGLWACTATAGQRTRTFWWRPKGPPALVPAPEGVTSWTSVDGRVTECRGGCKVPVDETPVMLTSR